MSSDPPEGDGRVLFRALPPRLKFSSDEKRVLSGFAHTLARDVVKGPFTCLITRDRELHNLNRMFLGQDYATDVLSFPARGESALAEIAIAFDRAQAQALEHGHSRIDEIRILMLHGALHLIGMDHENDDGAMARAERNWRSEFSLPSTLIMRAARSKVLQ